MFKIIKKADIVLFVILILIGLGLSWWSAASAAYGQKAVITVDGQLYGTYSLDENQTIEVGQDGHLNKITIKDGQVSMTFSDCSGQDCIQQGKISQTSQSITCLPNRIVIEIRGDSSEYDAVVR